MSYIFVPYLLAKNKAMMITRPTQLNNDFYYTAYIKVASGEELMQALRDIGNQTLKIFNQLSEEQSRFAYAEGKWTIKQVLRHITDAERVFAYRALRFSRKDGTALPGFEEDDYAASDNSHHLRLKSIIEEYIDVRKSTMMLFSTMPKDGLDFEGTASGLPMTPRIIGWTMVGHNAHHLSVLQERYLKNLL